MSITEYLEFMFKPENEFQCERCPENRHMDENGADRIYPCGQQNCWVSCHIGSGE